MPRLYTLTNKKQSLMSDIECTVRDRVDDTFSRLTAIKLDEMDGGNANLLEYEKMNAMFEECWQVVIAIMFHTNDIFRPRKAQWSTEFEVPYEIFERAVLNMISKMKWYFENPIIRDKQRYLDYIELLEDILRYRNKFETARD